MSLRLILGSSGIGKSHKLYQDIIQAAVRSPMKKFLVIVPEQFTMQTQRELVRMHPDGGLINIDVLSFPRLAHRVFEEVGSDTRTVLEETGKTLLLRRAAAKKEGELKILKSNLKKIGYLRQMKSMISELTQYDVDQEKMQKLLDAAKKPSLYYKLKDISLIYESFREELSDKYITAEETLEALCQAAGRSKILKGSVIALDGFTGFTPIQMKVLGELFTLAAEVHVTVTIDPDDDIYRIRGEHELFYLSKKTIRALTGLARERGCEMLPPVLLKREGGSAQGSSVPTRFADSPALAHLEENLFRGRKSRPFFQKNGGQGTSRRESDDFGISLHAAKDPVQEVHFAARTIRALAKKYRYQDMAVIVGDMESYANYIPRIFGEYGIPCFMDSTRSVFSDPLIEFIRALFPMLERDFTCESVFRWLRAGLCGLEREQLDLLENYVLASGVRGRARWSRPFTRKPGSVSEEQLALCDTLRGEIWERLEPFAARMTKNTTVREKTEALYDLLCRFDIQKQLAAMADGFGRANRPELKKEFDSIYGIVIFLFDKLVELLGEERLSPDEYEQLLEAGFEEARVRMIPPALDRVAVGDLERTRLQNIRVLFFLGLNDGWVPSSGADGGLLSDMDRESLSDSGVELAPTARQNSYIQKFYLYLNLTKPGERLYLSCSGADMDGAPLRPSYVLWQVMRLFPELSIRREDEEAPLRERVLTPKNGLSFLIGGLRDIRVERPKPEWLELYNWYRKHDMRAQAERLVQAAFLTADERGIGRLARELYGDVLVNSVSRLEKFASCAFAHFLQYGLRLSEREEYVFQPVDMGRVFHSAIERYSEKIERGGYDWFHMPEELRDRLIGECVDETARDYGLQILHDSARQEAVIGRMKRILRRAVWALHEQIAAGDFYPANFEVSFSQVEDLEAVNVALTDREKMRLAGRIDRIDVCERDRQVYVKVIDYKSGNTSFDLVALYHGLQLQLVVYLNAAMELERRIHPDREIVPAGVLYYHIDDPMLTVDGPVEPEKLNRKLLRELRPDGLINGDGQVLRAFERSLERISEVAPASVNKDGSLSAASKAVSTEQFEALLTFVRGKLQELGRRMMEGEIAPVPYQRKEQTACDYCAYRAVCGRDGKIPGTRTRRLGEYTKEDIWERIQRENTRRGGDGDGMDHGTAPGD